MKHYIDKNSQVWGIGEAGDIDGDQSFLVQDSWTLLTDAEYQAATTPAPIQITSITMRQARLALLAHNKLSDVQTTIDSLPSPLKEQAQIEWEYASNIEITNPLIVQLMGSLGFTETTLRDLFVEASLL